MVTAVAVDGPVLPTARLNVTLPPLGTTDWSTVFVTSRSASETPVPASVAVLFVASLSPPPETAAVFWIVGDTGLWTTAVKTIGGYERPTASGSLRAQVRLVVPAAIVHVQPVAETMAIESKPAAPLGTLSVTVTGVPSVGSVPAFETVSVNVVVSPATNAGECDFVSVRSGAATVVTTSFVTAVSAVASVCERNSAFALFVIRVPTGSVVPTFTL